MNVATVKSGKRGRPSFRRSVGILRLRAFGGFADWIFIPDDLDLFGWDLYMDSCRVYFSDRDCLKLCRYLPSGGKPLRVEVAFTSRFKEDDGITRWEIRIRRFVA